MLITLAACAALAIIIVDSMRFQSLVNLQNTPGTIFPAVRQTSSISREDLTVSIVQQSQTAIVTVAEKLATSQMRSLFNNSGVNLPQNLGSGFIITSDGYIVTSRHVVADVGESYVILTANGLEYSVSQIFRDPDNDLALLKINSLEHPNQTLYPLPLGDSSQVKVGEYVLAIGTALGQFPNTVTQGVISGIGRGVEAGDFQTGQTDNLQDLLQTSAAINQGNSGGPLLDLSGQVVGVNTAVLVNGEDIGFAIPINEVKSFSKNLVQAI